ncbi:MAG: Nramp family divalent metal transporter [Luminiphilus sp.]|nr:Nramp family divalent metal transporter [Luminiphilus sp.]
MGLRIGPGAMVAAAFIGPGTITTASVAGATTGITLIWAIVFSVLATVLLQELAVRSALTTDRDLASLIKGFGAGRWWGTPLLLLIILAVGVGNAAYQSGNLSGAGIGLSTALGIDSAIVVLLCAIAAAILIVINRYRWLERILVALVAMMGVLFSALAILLAPLLSVQSEGRLLPDFSSTNLTLVLALIGTTVVPYNLFLHATAARQRWQGCSVGVALSGARWESCVAIFFGGVTTVAIVVVAAALVPGTTDQSPLNAVISAIEVQLPGWGAIVLGIGLFAAGLTSAIAAPVAAGWTICGAMGWSVDPDSSSFKIVALTVVLIGSFFALVTTRPAALIVTAQVTNALLLPLIALVLMMVANSALLPSGYRNSAMLNTLAALVLATMTLLAVGKLVNILG